jgi:flagellar biosynthetic protein FliQ
MTIEQASEAVRQTLLLALFLAAPPLLAGLIVGLAISLLQAVTQIQEQSLVFVPKIAAMVAAAVVALPWMLVRLTAFVQQMWTGP